MAGFVEEAASDDRGTVNTRLTINRLRRVGQWLQKIVTRQANARRGMDRADQAMAAADPLMDAVVYRVKRDALMVLARMNKGILDTDTMKRHITFIQHQLIIAAIRDPAISEATKSALLALQDMTVRETISDRRGAKRRIGEDDGFPLSEARLSIVKRG